ncbi:MAG: tyrosine-type recombinase/integrase [Allobaculum sp.]|nr:tyrosine-type recombinase/integrase [Allobaculum sp.]
MEQIDVKERLLSEITALMAQRGDPETVREMNFRIATILEKYEVTEKTYEVMATDTESALHLLQLFLIAKKVEGLSERSLAYYKMEINSLIISLGKPVEAITTNDIRLYIFKVKGGASKVTQDNVLRIFKSFFGWCNREEYILRNPCARISKIKADQVIKRPFSEFEIERLRNNIEDVKEKAIFDLLLSTGCRIGEIEKMNRNELEGDQIVAHGKGGKDRYVYLNAKAVVSLDNYLRTRTDDNEALFVSDNAPHGRLHISGMETRMRELGKRAGVQNVHPHRFRRTAATMALNRGMAIEEVQKMLGHSQIQTTLIYAQSAQENVKAAHKRYLT